MEFMSIGGLGCGAVNSPSFTLPHRLRDRALMEPSTPLHGGGETERSAGLRGGPVRISGSIYFCFSRRWQRAITSARSVSSMRVWTSVEESRRWPTFGSGERHRRCLPTKEAPIFDQRLAALRRAKGLSQTQLAELLDITRKMIDYYERRADNPSLNFIKGAAGALDVSVAELLVVNQRPHAASLGQPRSCNSVPTNQTISSQRTGVRHPLHLYRPGKRSRGVRLRFYALIHLTSGTLLHKTSTIWSSVKSR
jgi:transcriptional regulator with XRE-family HTH domain